MSKEEKELIHHVRLQGEEPIFRSLQEKYGSIYKKFWTNPQTIFPVKSSNQVLLVERRPHPNIEFVLQNAMYFCQDFSLTIVCSNENEEYIRNILGHHTKTTNILPLFQGIGDYTQGRNEYNALFLNKDFWSSLDATYILSIQTDSYLRYPLPDYMWEYDYIASPWAWNLDLVGGGGLTWRKKECILDCLEKSKQDIKNISGEDCFFANACFELDKKIPPIEIRTTTFVESFVTIDPIGLHQWWTYLFRDIHMTEEEREKYVKDYIRIPYLEDTS